MIGDQQTAIVLTLVITLCHGLQGNKKLYPGQALNLNTYHQQIWPQKQLEYDLCYKKFNFPFHPLLFYGVTTSVLVHQLPIPFFMLVQNILNWMLILLEIKFQISKVQVRFVFSIDQTIDCFTKPLSHSRFFYVRDKLGVLSQSPSRSRRDVKQKKNLHSSKVWLLSAIKWQLSCSIV